MGASHDPRVSRRLTAQSIDIAGLTSRFDLSAEQTRQFEAYLELLLRWNARINLTSVREPTEIARRHFAECIFAAQHLPRRITTLLDFGSGAGLPGIPMAVCRPEVAVTLAESQGKKAAFLQEVVRTLGLRAEIWDRRAEQLPRERVFDAVTLRAVDRMVEACRIAIERLKPSGRLIAFATRRTEPALRKVKGMIWRELPIPDSEQGLLLIGSRDAHNQCGDRAIS